MLSLAVCIACTDEPNETNFKVNLKNTTINSIEIETFIETQIVFRVNLDSGENSPPCDYIDENFRGIFLNYCGIDSMVIKFNDGRGFISTSTNSGNFNFSKMRNPLLPNGGFQKSGNVYEFLVTQEDYENAYVLLE